MSFVNQCTDFRGGGCVAIVRKPHGLIDVLNFFLKYLKKIQIDGRKKVHSRYSVWKKYML
jgi:hypothetical protein